MSRLLTFEDGSDEVRVQCYLHTSQYAPQGVVRPGGTDDQVEPAGKAGLGPGGRGPRSGVGEVGGVVGLR